MNIRVKQVRGVTLVDPQGLALDAAYLVPLGPGEVLGTSAYPPKSSQWAHRAEAGGAIVPAGEQRNLLLVLQRTDERRGAAESIRVEYTVGAHRFAKDGDLSFELADSCS